MVDDHQPMNMVNMADNGSGWLATPGDDQLMAKNGVHDTS